MDDFAMFRELFDAAVAVCGGTQTSLAEALGVQLSTVNTWVRRRRWPNGVTLCEIADLVAEKGGVLPGWWAAGKNPLVEGAGVAKECGRGYGRKNRGGGVVPGLRFIGRVQAGKLTTPREAWEMVEHERMWRDSLTWQWSEGEVHLAEVDGDSMAPLFPAGSVIACRRPGCAAVDLPDRTPVVATVGAEATVKLWHLEGRRDDAGAEVALLPLNIMGHDVVRAKLGEIRVDFVVLGVVVPWGKGSGR